MQDSLMHMVDVLLSYKFSTNPEINGKSIAGHIENGIVGFIEWIL